MAPIIENNYVGDGSTVLFSFTFEYIETVDVEVSIDSVTVATTEYSLANATTIEFNTAPAVGAAIRIYRNTTVTSPKAEFFPGSAIRAQDLNDNFEQILFVTQEADAIAERAEEAADAAEIATANAEVASAAATSAAATAETAATDALALVTIAQTAATDAANDADAATITANNALSVATDAEAAATQAEADATAAAADAATAAAEASTANTASANAQAQAAAAASSAATAAADASDAALDASTASAAAINASADALTAINTADSAVTTANSAVTTANSAVSTANTAASDASIAVSTANVANTKSDTAIADSASAVTTANTADGKADSAVATANTAASDAATAVSTANTADTNASSAVTTANAADGKADTAIADSATAVSTANSANTTAGTAETNSTAALTAANNAVTTADDADTKADSAVATANTAASDAATAVSTANTANTNASSAVTTANAADGKADTAIADSATAVTTANSAVTTANSASSTANTADTNASNAVTTADDAETKADAAVATANSADSKADTAIATANTADSNASAAVSTANSADSKADTAIADSASAVTSAGNAVSTANSADTKADSAVATANSAATDAATAISTANTAETNSNAAISTANSASTTASNAVTTANDADTKADSAVATANSAATDASQAQSKSDAAIAAVSDAYLFSVVANVAAIPSSPADGDAVRVADSTGIESFSPIQSVPTGYVGDPGINVEIVYETSNTSWIFLKYNANDPDDRYGYPPYVDITRQNTVDAATLSGVALNSTDLGTFTGSTITDNQTIKGALQDLESGKADLVGGKVPTSQIPSLAITEFLGTVSSESALLALSGQKGDWAIRSDLGRNYVLIVDGGSTLSDWVQLASPAAPVDSVNGQTGVVSLGPSDVGALASTGGTISGNLSVTGTVNGRDYDSDGSKLDSIESGATGDQTAAEIRAAVEAATDSNVFTDADHSKLNGIEAGADVNVPTNLANSADTTSVTITSSTGNNTTIPAVDGSTAGVMTVDQRNKLANIESNATADQTAAEIRTLVQSATDSNVFTDTLKTKLDGIESGATGDQSASEILTLLKTVDGPGSGLDADTIDGLGSSFFVRSDTSDTMDGNLTVTGTGSFASGNYVINSDGSATYAGDVTFSGGSGAITLSAGSDIKATTGTWTGEAGSNTGKIQYHNNTWYFQGHNGWLFRDGSGGTNLYVDSSGNLTVNGTVEGRDMATDGAKLDSIASGAQVNVGTNLSTSSTTTQVTISSSTGNDTVLSQATSSVAGLMTVAHHDKLDGIASGAQVNVATNLGKSTSTTSNTITSSTGSDVTINEATSSAAGLMSTTHHDKLDGIASGAQVNVGTNLGVSRSSTNVTVTSSTGDNVVIGEPTGSNAGVMTSAQKSKLDGIESGATGDQTASEILSLIKTVDGSGSGLDADTLDGVSSASFVRSDANDTLTGDYTVDGDLTVNTFNGGQLAGMRNRIINGDFRIWQRGTSFSNVSTIVYTADRWAVGASGTAVNVGQGGHPTTYSQRKSLNIFPAGSGNTRAFALTRIESGDVLDLVGEEVTFSTWVYRTNSDTVELFVAYANAVDDFSTITNFTQPSYSHSGGWQKLTVTVTLPTDAQQGLQLLVNLPDGIPSGESFAVTDCQLERGSVATQFEVRPVSLERTMCERYYETSYREGITPNTPNLGVKDTGHILVNGSVASSAVIVFRTKKRDEPAVVIAAPGTDPPENRVRKASNGTIKTISGPFITPDSIVFNIDSGNAGDVHQLGYTADAEL